jgi:hypothetical protein
LSLSSTAGQGLELVGEDVPGEQDGDGRHHDPEDDLGNDEKPHGQTSG